MTLKTTAVGPSPKSLISEMEDLYHDIAGEVFALLKRLKTGDWEPKSATHAVRELRSFLEFVLDERMKVAKLSKQEAGAVHDYALDFDAARDEIGRRLARLRDAGGG